jgi:thiol:disulfide interchange protein DsbC
MPKKLKERFVTMKKSDKCKSVWGFRTDAIAIRSGLYVFAVLFSLTVMLIPGRIQAFSDSGCEGDCSKCHTINKAEAIEIVKKMKMADAKVTDVKMSPIKGLWEISIQRQDKDVPVYLDFSKKFVIEGPIIEISTGVDKTKEQYKEPVKEPVKVKKTNKGIDVSGISLKNALVLGNKKAAKRVIVFTDPECPYCGVLHEEMKKVVSKRKDIVFFIRLFPLIKLHPDAYWKSKSIVCSKSMQMLDDNFMKKPIYRNECDTKEVDNTMKLAGNLNITGTPTMIFADGSMHSGAMRAEDLIKTIDGKHK